MSTNVDSAPLVSIILPLFNATSFLKKGIECIRGQTFTNWELIAINDGSTDDTETMLRSLTLDMHQRLVLHTQENAGGFAARNTGLNLATGKYIAFFDIDDHWYPNHLADLVTFLEAEPRVDWCYAANKILDLTTHSTVAENSLYTSTGPKAVLELESETIGQFHLITDPKAIQCQILDGLWCGQQFSLIRREVFAEYRFSADYRNEGADQLSVISALARGVRFAYTTQVHGIYHIHASNASAGCKDAPIEKYLRLRLALIKGFLEVSKDSRLGKAEQGALRKRIAKEYFWSIGYRLFLLHGNATEARKYFMLGLKSWPWSPLMWKTYIGSFVKSVFNLHPHHLC